MAATATATDRVAFRGVTVNRATRAAILYMEEHLLPASFPRLELVQGSYQPKTEWSGTSHMGGGVVDFRTHTLTVTQKKQLRQAARDVGFAYWDRDERDGFDPHGHGCLFGDGGQDMAPSAQRQRIAYDKGLNGLDNAKADRYPYRPDPKVKWSWAKDKPVRR